MRAPPLTVGQDVIGPLFNEPMLVETLQPSGPTSWTVGLVGTESERFRRVTLSGADVACLKIVDTRRSYDGDGRLLPLGLQAYSPRIASEFDPSFGLSISRVHP